MYYVVSVHFQGKLSHQHITSIQRFGWSGGAMVLGKLPVPGRQHITSLQRFGWSGSAMVLGKLPVPTSY